jgi:hypothetical protein
MSCIIFVVGISKELMLSLSSSSFFSTKLIQNILYNGKTWRFFRQTDIIDIF